MKIRSFKTMALFFAMAVMTSSVPAFANHPCPTVHQVRQLEERAIGDLQGIIGNLNDVLVALAFTTDPASTHVNNLEIAENGGVFGNPGSAAQQALDLADVLNTLTRGTRVTQIQNVVAQLEAFYEQGNLYGQAVATGADSTAVYNAWTVIGTNLANAFISLSDNFSAARQAKITQQIQDLIINLTQSTQGFREDIPGLDTLTAVADDQEAHFNVLHFIRPITKQLLRDHCRR